MSYAIAYGAALLVFGVVDALWLGLMGPVLYMPVLKEVLAPSIRIAPAIAFYLMYPIGIVAFGVVPALRADSGVVGMASALLFGALAYGTYDLTNYATLKVWSLPITLMDIAYGAAASAIATAAAFYAIKLSASWFGTTLP